MYRGKVTRSDGRVVTVSVPIEMKAFRLDDRGLIKDFDCRLDLRACSLCTDETVEEVDEYLPSGMALKIKCSKGHTTNGFPTQAWFDQRDLVGSEIL